MSQLLKTKRVRKMVLLKAVLLSCAVLLTFNSTICYAQPASIPPIKTPTSFNSATDAALPKIAKVFGAGGAARLEGYQSGVVISGSGHVLTAWSYVLDDDEVTVVLSDGQRYKATLVGADPRTEIALLKLEYDGTDLPHFKLSEAVELKPNSRVLALSNIYRVATGNEPVSVQHGIVSAVAPLQARSGSMQSRFRGKVYYLDAVTNNPGAAGGALTNSQGQLAGVLGKEVRAGEGNTWLNYALPISACKQSVQQMLDGKFLASEAVEDEAKPENPMTTAALGLVLVPSVVPQTPPFVDAVRKGTPAQKAGIRPDDLVVFIEDQLVPSCDALQKMLARYERDDQIHIVVVRDNELVELTLSAEGE